MTAARKSILLELPAELADRLDRHWPGFYPSRRAAIRHMIETGLAAHAASVQRERAAAAPPGGGWARPGTPDDRAAEVSRPLTADLADL